MEQHIFGEGDVLAKRYEILAEAGESDLGKVYKAKDRESGRLAAVRVFPENLDPTVLESLKKRVEESSKLKHQNIRQNLGMGTDNGVVFVAAEWIEGQNLRRLLSKRSEQNKRFSLKGAYNIIGHVCNALKQAHTTMHHGALSPRAIMVSDAGRVKVGDWELSSIRTSRKNESNEEKRESTFWAPEVLKGRGKVDDKSDIFSLGAIFYELITGVTPARPLKAPSLMGFSKDIDKVVARCMAADPARRYSKAADVKAAIVELVKKQGTDTCEQEIDDNLGIDMEVDLSELGERKPSGPKKAAAPVPNTMLNAPGLPPPPGPGKQKRAADNSRYSTIDMGAVISGLGKSEAARWMVQKDKFDHGPFTDRELVQMILQGEVLSQHELLNMDDGVRKKVAAYGHFDEFLEKYRLKKKEEDERLALQQTEKAEKRGSAFQVGLALGVLGLVVLSVGGYFVSRQLREEKTYTPDEMIAALESGEIKLKTGGNLIDKDRRRGRGGRRRGGGGGSGGGEFVPGMSYEEAMNMGVNLGAVNDNSGQQQLKPQDITRIMDRNVRRFLPCVAGQSVKRVSMDIAIAGDGRIIGVSVNEGDSKLKKCVASKVRSINFPRSSAPRTAASWFFELY